jgi:hypothetical protein
MDTSLQVDRDDQPFVGHGNILGWPEDIGRQRESGFKAGAGIEPANRGFADLGLTTWLPRRRENSQHRL